MAAINNFRIRFSRFLQNYDFALKNGILKNIQRQGAFAVQAPDKFGKTTLLHQYTTYVDTNDLLRSQQTLFQYLELNKQEHKSPTLIGLDNVLELYKQENNTIKGKLAIDILKEILEHDMCLDGKMGIIMTDEFPLAALLYHQSFNDTPLIWYPKNAAFGF